MRTRVRSCNHALTRTRVDLSLGLTIAYSYNEYGQKTAQTDPNGLTTEMTYDSRNRLIERKTGMRSMKFAYNARDLITRVTDELLGNITWHGPNLGSYRLGNGLTTEMSYDAADRLIAKAWGGSDNRLQNQLDQQDQITQQTWTRNGQSDRNDFQYDPLGRITQDGAGDWRFSYDPNSNRMNRIDTTPVTRDPTGNTLDDGRRQYQYNAMNRLSRLDDRTTGIHAQYHYNPLGQRIRKQLTGAQTQDIRYIYGQDGELLGEYDRNGERIREYIYQRTGTFPERIAQIEADGGITYIHTDHLGSPRLATNSNQTVIWRWDSEAFGGTPPDEDPDQDGIATTIHHRFPGQQYDVESGLYYNYFRTYDPSTGRYLESDPIGLRGGINTYTYALDNPLRWTDSLGLDVLLCHRPADLPFPLNQFDHYWIKTDTLEAGMGGMRGGVPGQNGNSDRPYDPTQTVDHSGQSNASNASCEKQNNVDEQCVNDLIRPGQPTGSWNPFNQCQSFAYSTINRCRTGPQISPR